MFVCAAFFAKLYGVSKKPVSIQDASASKKPVLLIRKDDTRLTFQKIILKGSNYYGMLKENGQIIKIPIVESDIKTIRMLDQTTSLWGTIGILLGGMTILGIISFSISLYGKYFPENSRALEVSKTPDS